MTQSQPSAAAYTRAKHREGKLPISTKFFQAIGGLPDAMKTWAFNTFLLLYYSQILGLPASWVSVVLTVSIFIDAITDPMVGSYSDGLKTRLGRRHPLMYAAILPLGLCLYLVFAPPSDLSQAQLLAWLACFAIGSRVAMTFYLVPWTATFAELSDDYAERSEILAWRYLVGGFGTIAFTMAMWSFIFPSGAADSPGQLGQENYELFAPILAVCVMIAAFASTLLTQREVPYLLQPVDQVPFGLRKTLADLWDALQNKDFLVLFAGLMIAALLTGTIQALDIYMQTYFWGFGPDELKWWSLAALGGIVAFILMPLLQRRFDKRDILIWSMVFTLFQGLIIISLRFADLLPDNGDPLLLQILLVNEFVRFCAVVITAVMFISMVADTLDAQELATGKRQEGVFSAAISFSNKAISGFGVLAAGLILEFGVGIVQGAKPSELPEETVFRLGVAIICVASLYAVPFYIAPRYKLTRADHQRIHQALEERRAALK